MVDARRSYAPRRPDEDIDEIILRPTTQ